MNDNKTPTFKVISVNGKPIKEKSTKEKRKFFQKKNKDNSETVVHIPLFKIAMIIFCLSIAYTAFTGRLNLQDVNGDENIYLSEEVNEVSSDTIVTETNNIAATVNLRAYETNGSHTGSGVIWGVNKKNQLVILTAKHVVEYEDDFYVDVHFVDGTFYPAANIYVSTYNDFAFVTVDIENMGSNTLNVIQTIKYDKDVEYHTGDSVYVIGMHASKGLLKFSGKISSLDIINMFGKLDNTLYELTTSFAVTPGTSGGGIFSENGTLLGICSKGNDDMTTFIPIYQIIDRYNETFE